MKRFLVLLFLIFPCIVHADTMNLNWIVDSQTYAQTTCTVGGDLTLPTAPTKYGYTFQGWVSYTPIEYIESTGLQYIDAGFYPNQDTHVVMTVTPKSCNDSATMFFGARDENTATGSGHLTFFDWMHNGKATSDFASSRIEGSSIDCNKKIIIDKNKFQSLWTYAQTGTRIFSANHPNKLFQKNKSLYLLAVNQGYPDYLVTGLLYSTQIYDNDVLVRDFIPVLDYNNTPCLYDKVSGTFFYNAGSGDFIAGPTL